MIKLSDEIKESIYLQYTNEFLTINRMTEYFQDYNYFQLGEYSHNEAYEILELIITEGREINHSI